MSLATNVGWANPGDHRKIYWYASRCTRRRKYTQNVFTGLVEAKTEILEISSSRLVIGLPGQWSDDPIELGESISVNGCCLTVTVIENDRLSFDLSEETWQKTTFSGESSGSIVNLERAMTASSRFGGHLVTGHVDTVGQVISAEGSDGFHHLVITYPSSYAGLVSDKGSICVDGISLTVNNPTQDQFEAAIIPETWARTNLSQRTPGSKVNLEFDLIAKQVERAVALRLGPAS